MKTIKKRKGKKRKYKNPYIKKSLIHGKGLFSHKKYIKNDIIFEDVFPHFKKEQTYENMFIFFNKFILNKCKYINHCKKKQNVNIIQKNNKYLVIATKNINKDEELLSNYDIVHFKFPFIDKSKYYYVEC
tara:strand:- start:429 stop:818 length:390 start_codon:yes stop_codon:yes gene_type:complete